MILFANTDWYLFNFRLSRVELKRRGCYVDFATGTYTDRFASLTKWLAFRSIAQSRSVRAGGTIQPRPRLQGESQMWCTTSIKCAVYGSVAANGLASLSS